MNESKTTLVVSDLHLGGGARDTGDDHIWQGEPLRRLIDEQCASEDGRKGAVELFFNGDFLEFAQANQAAYANVSDEQWCTEDESLAKLETIVSGHANIFEALRRFTAAGNAVTIAAGNHDIDLVWPRVQARLRQVAGDGLRFEIGQEWIKRHAGRLQIGHGNQHDVANRFEHWDDPIRHGAWGLPYLEMCPGTLFMVKFVNRLEARYPFADNMLPVTKLVPVLLSDDKAGFASVAWMFMRLLGTTDFTTLGAETTDDLGQRLLQRAKEDAGYRAEVGAALLAAQRHAAHAEWQAGPVKTRLLQKTMLELLGRVGDAEWHRLFDAPTGAPGLGDSNEAVTLNALRRAASVDGKLALRKAARERATQSGAQVVVMGHTHQPDEVRDADFAYFNPGSWTRYLELDPNQKVTMADLVDEARYPYALNYVRVVPQPNGQLQARLVCFESHFP